MQSSVNRKRIRTRDPNRLIDWLPDQLNSRGVSMDDEIQAPKDMRTFLIIWVGQFVSILGSGLTSFGLAVWIFDQTQKATPLVFTLLFGSIPRILLSPVAGSLADRWNRRFIMILSDTLNAVATLGVLLLFTFGDVKIWHIYSFALLTSVFSAFQGPAYSASIVMMVPKKHLARANGFIQLSQALDGLITPVIAGILFVAIGLSGIMVIDFVSFFFAVGALLFVRIPQPKLKADSGGLRANFVKDTKFGWNYLRQRPGLMGLLWYFAITNFCLNFAAVLMTPAVLTFDDARVLGMVQMVFGSGMLVGSIVMSSWGGPQKARIPAVITFIGLGATGLIIAGIYPASISIAVGMFVLLFFVPLASGVSSAVFQSKVEPEVQGRVFGIRSLISQSAMPLAFLTAGPLADYVFEPAFQDGGFLASSWFGSFCGSGPGRGIDLMFITAGIVLVVITLLVFANPRIRRLEDELPDVAEVRTEVRSQISNASRQKTEPVGSEQ